MGDEKAETDEEPKEELKKRRPTRTYPLHTLQEALIIPKGIQDKNAGKPMKRILLADAIGRTPSSSEYINLLSSSFKYGLTLGTEKAEEIQLTDLGKRTTMPTNPVEEKKALIEAVLKPELFKKIFEHYNNAKLPSGQFFHNTLEREFDVPREHVQECEQMIKKNGELAGIIIDISGSPYIQISGKGTPTTAAPQKLQEAEADTPQEKPEVPTAPVKEKEILKPKQIFIAHGKKAKPLEQIKKILDEFGVPYKVAVEEANSGRPVSQKVADTMMECSSGIFIFTGDEKLLDPQGKEIFRPSENVVFELGAGSVLYGKKIVIFKEEGVTFPTDFKEIGHISFETDRLDSKTPELMKELIGFGILKISAA